MKIQEVIVVEGVHDSATLKRYFDVDTIETGGSALSKQTLDYIKNVQAMRGIIVFTDPDYPGERIRSKIMQYVPSCKHAFLPQEQAKGKKKIGIEHAVKEDLSAALEHCVTYTEAAYSDLTVQDMTALGLQGMHDSKELRSRVCAYYHIGICNAKTLCQRLRLLQVTKAALQDCLEAL